MEWIVTIFAGLVFLALLAPVGMLLLTFFVLVPLAHLAPAPAMLARATFACPVSRRTVSAAFLTSPRSEHAVDVEQCSAFPHGRVACKKGCLALAAVGWAPSPMVPRVSLVAGGTAMR